MPIYTYECDQGHRFEDFGTYEDKVRVCPDCKNIAVRVPSAPAPAQFNCKMPTYQRPKKGNT